MIRNNKNMLFYKTPKKSKLMIINNFLPNYLGSNLIFILKLFFLYLKIYRNKKVVNA